MKELRRMYGIKKTCDKCVTFYNACSVLSPSVYSELFLDIFFFKIREPACERKNVSNKSKSRYLFLWIAAVYELFKNFKVRTNFAVLGFFSKLVSFFTTPTEADGVRKRFPVEKKAVVDKPYNLETHAQVSLGRKTCAWIR